MKKVKISFVGAGNMASAIIKAIHLSDKSNDFEIFGFDIDNQKLADLESFGVKSKSMSEISIISDFILLAVKPQNIKEVLNELKPNINKNTVIVSILAGISGEYIKAELGFDAKVILVMPNTPLLLGEGATALSRVDPTSIDEFNTVVEIFKSCGVAYEIEPSKMKEIIAINGSSPAFTYLFAKGFLNYAKSVGIDEEIALNLFSQTLIGSAKMMTSSGFDIDTLISQVSSKGGTTVAGLEEFERNDFLGCIEKSCKKCTQRAYELSK
jgi:pyrroline-5-carboxylate reductase